MNRDYIRTEQLTVAELREVLADADDDSLVHMAVYATGESWPVRVALANKEQDGIGVYLYTDGDR